MQLPVVMLFSLGKVHMYHCHVIKNGKISNQNKHRSPNHVQLKAGMRKWAEEAPGDP